MLSLPYNHQVNFIYTAQKRNSQFDSRDYDLFSKSSVLRPTFCLSLDSVAVKIIVLQRVAICYYLRLILFYFVILLQLKSILRSYFF